MRIAARFAIVVVLAICSRLPALAADDLDALNRRVVELYGKNKYREATAVAENALALAERTLGAEHPDTLSSVNWLGSLYRVQGQHSEAEPFYRRALAGREKTLGPEHPSTLASLNNLGLLYQAQGRHAEAEPLLKRALAGREKALGPEHPDTLGSLLSLAAVYQSQGRYGEAKPLLKRALAGYEKALGPEHPFTLRSANNLGLLYQSQGLYGEAEPLLKRALAGNEKTLGPAHLDTLGNVNNLATLYQVQGRHAEAEPLYRRALAGHEQALGPEHPSTLTSVGNLAVLHRAQGRYSDAEPLYRRTLAGRERTLGQEHPDTLMSVNNLAVLYQLQGRHVEAEPLFQRALADRARALGPTHPDTLMSVNNLSFFYQSQGRYAEAELLFQRALEGREKALGPEHPDTLQSVGNLGGLYQAQGRYDEVEPLYNRALASFERTLGLTHPDTLGSVNNLGFLYTAQGRYGEAEPLFQRALAGHEEALGPEHPFTLTSVGNLGTLYEAQGRYREAEPFYQRALAGREKALGPEHPDTLAAVNNLAALYDAQGRYTEAEPLYRRALTGGEKVLGPEHPMTLTSANNLGYLYSLQGRHGEAEPLYRRALTGRETALGLEHPSTITSVSNLATLHFAQGHWAMAAELWRRSTATITLRVQRGARGGALTGKKKSEAELSDWQFRTLVKAVYRLAPEGRPDAAIAGEMFQSAQWALSSDAAQSLAQMAARGAKGDPALAALVRERQDLADEWQGREKLQATSLGQSTEKRDAKAETENRERMTGIDRRIAEIDQRLKIEFPDYAALASPAPLSITDAQAQLGIDEVLVLFLDTPEAKTTPEETFIWLVTKTEMRWARSDLGRAALAREVAALRCGLDAAEWGGKSRCPGLTGQSQAGRLLPFDHARAHRLYKALFGQAEDLIKDKQLLIVPSGALTQLPFAVLVTAPPQAGGKIAWLARDHAISVLPAVSSLKALRATGHASAAAKPLIGFGNPLLDGGNSQSKAAQLARETKTCPNSFRKQVADLFGLRQGRAPVHMRGGLADVSELRQWEPLPETADELCAVARDIGADERDIRLGGHATEAEVKSMSADGRLSEYRVVHFATHGAMAGDLKSSEEPGLVLTPPDAASGTDDGYLSASEIASLKLDADWVILSACNTAAGQAANAEALSGLARAFIYAQARALLVSHWAVESNATVKLITTAMREIARDKTVGRAEALRRAMLGMIDGRDADQSHPAYWAPFIVVGEGTR